jgi:hypothetical protein
MLFIHMSPVMLTPRPGCPPPLPTTKHPHDIQARAEAESWLPRLKDAEKDIFKLERALELKVGGRVVGQF